MTPVKESPPEGRHAENWPGFGVRQTSLKRRLLLLALIAGASFAGALLLRSGGSLAGSSLAAYPGQTSKAAPLVPLIIQARGKSFVFRVELARTPEERMLGLMFRTSVVPDGGMLFISRPAGIIQMWMKNTLIPLDMLFIDETGRIVHITRNAEPKSLRIISSVYPVVGVLEVAGGTAGRLGLRQGDFIRSSALTGQKQ